MQFSFKLLQVGMPFISSGACGPVVFVTFIIMNIKGQIHA